MPELPEVETIKNSLNRYVIGKRITGLKIIRWGLLKEVEWKELEAKLIGAAISSIRRRAKYLIFDLDNTYSLVFHLGLEGLFFLNEKDTENINLIFHFEDGDKLYFDDIKDYSRLFLVRADEVEGLPSIAKLGIEPFQESYTLSRFSKLLRSRQEIKRLLLDQHKVAGLGNIYASELLYLCGIHPQRLANQLSLNEARCLFDEIPKLLEQAIEKRGTSVYHYRDIDGSKGEFQSFLKVYGRAGEPCERCGSPIKEVEQGGRRTFFCPQCQPLQPAGGMETLFP